MKESWAKITLLFITGFTSLETPHNGQKEEPELNLSLFSHENEHRSDELTQSIIQGLKTKGEETQNTLRGEEMETVHLFQNTMNTCLYIDTTFQHWQQQKSVRLQNHWTVFFKIKVKRYKITEYHEYQILFKIMMSSITISSDRSEP